ncbi:MAG: hypothetical protein QOJ16_2936, partial [Acidobacteriota bacterium]|nr:hypothetical protein [Acidobacteriota bacterium]
MKRQFLLAAVGLLSMAVSASAASPAPALAFLFGGKAVCPSAAQTPAPLFMTQFECFEG